MSAALQMDGGRGRSSGWLASDRITFPDERLRFVIEKAQATIRRTELSHCAGGFHPGFSTRKNILPAGGRTEPKGRNGISFFEFRP